MSAAADADAGAAIYEVPGAEVEQLPPLEGINLHAFRWDHAIAFGRWLLKDEYPRQVTVFLIEGESFELGDGLSPAVDRAVDELVELLAVRLQLPPEEPARAVARLRDRLRTAEGNPVGHARTPLNQANALGHFGVFGSAVETLAAAAVIFAEQGCEEEPTAPEELTAEMQSIPTQPGSSPGSRLGACMKRGT